MAAAALCGIVGAQGETGFTRGRGKLDVVLSYGEDVFPEQFLGGSGDPDDVLNFEVGRDTTNLYAAYGLTDDLDLILSASYVSARFLRFNDPSPIPGSFFTPEENWQDLVLAAKWRFYERPLGRGRFSLLASPGIKVPLSDYLDDGFISLGAGQVDLRARVIAHWQEDRGRFWGSLETGYDHRNGEPPDEIPVSLTLGVNVANAVTLMPFYARIEGLDDDFTETGGFTGGDGFTRWGVNAYGEVYRRGASALGLSASYRISDDGRAGGDIDGWSFGVVWRHDALAAGPSVAPGAAPGHAPGDVSSFY